MARHKMGEGKEGAPVTLFLLSWAPDKNGGRGRSARSMGVSLLQTLPKKKKKRRMEGEGNRAEKGEKSRISPDFISRPSPFSRKQEEINHGHENMRKEEGNMRFPE